MMIEKQRFLQIIIHKFTLLHFPRLMCLAIFQKNQMAYITESILYESDLGIFPLEEKMSV
jgi:hypothetical protein